MKSIMKHLFFVEIVMLLSVAMGRLTHGRRRSLGKPLPVRKAGNDV